MSELDVVGGCMRWIQHNLAKSVPKAAMHIYPDYPPMSLRMPDGYAVHTHGDVNVGMPDERGWFGASGNGRVWFAPSNAPDQETHLMRWQED